MADVNADLIAELRRAANKKRDDLAYQSAQLFDRAADALESVTKDAEWMESYGIDYGDEIEEGYKTAADARESLDRVRRQSEPEDLYLYLPGTIVVRTVGTFTSQWLPVDARTAALDGLARAGQTSVTDPAALGGSE